MLFCAAWVSTFFGVTSWLFKTESHYYAAYVEQGCFIVLRFDDEPSQMGLMYVKRSPVDPWLTEKILWVEMVSDPKWPSLLGVSVPLWIPFLIVAVPTCVLIRMARNYIPPGHCQTCGYNLRGKVSGVCPRCDQRI